MKIDEKEIIKLADTLKIIKELLLSENESYKKLFTNYLGSREELWREADFKKATIRKLENAEKNPYFARIDFSYEDTNNKKESIYIGRNGVIKDGNSIVTDWRAPISSLYYDSELGKCSFNAPGGVMEGTLSLKRQYEIENGKLLNYFDVDLVSNDALLQKYLGENNDSRVKSIVATIQKEQNEVIRKKLSDNLIIQGVAGSGKTTVALHRIAYLVYNYINSIKQNQYLVIGPNPVFLKYIKSVLPDLDVTGVNQFTYEEFARRYIDEDITINSSENKLINSINGIVKNDVDKFKSSLKYKEMIDKFLSYYFLSITQNDLKINEFVVLNKSLIYNVFNQIFDNYPDLDYKGKIDLIVERVCNLIQNDRRNIISKYDDYSFNIFKNAKTNEEKDKIRKKIKKDKEEISKNCKSIVKKYFSKVNMDPIKLYKLFLSNINDYDIYNYKYLNDIKRQGLNSCKNNMFDFEDLAALMYIKRITSHSREYNDIRQVVIDEAQDLGEFNYISLKKCLPSATFSIFGDLAQAIYDYRSIDDWNVVNKIMFNNEGQIIKFGKSYRTTTEIMNVADYVSESIGLGKSDLILRHGNPVELDEITEKKDIPNYIVNKINEYKAKGYKTIAVISKTDLMSLKINEQLRNYNLEIPNVSMEDDVTSNNYNVCTISNQLAKGLEFDAVILNGASEDIYSSESSLDMKLLYVAITRALHEVDIVYSGSLTKPLHNYFNENSKIYLKKIER